MKLFQHVIASLEKIVSHACIFCQQKKKLSNEHIFPRWLQAHLGVHREKLFIYSDDSGTPTRTMIYESHTNGRVCEDCNGGWMKRIENVVRPILISMLDCGTSLQLSSEQGASLAWWIYKTAITLHSASPYRKSVPQHHYQLALQQTVPAHTMIAIAYCENKILLPSWIQNQNWPSLSRFLRDEELKSQIATTYRITFGFGNFAARVHYFPLRYNLFEMDSESIRYVHPGDPNGFNWPIRPTIGGLPELDQSLVVTGDPVQNSENARRFLEESLLNQINDQNHDQ